MAEVKFIFTADDSKLQSAIARVEKSLGNVGASSSVAAKSASRAIDDIGDSLENAGEKAKNASQIFEEYDKKIIALNSQISGLKNQLENIPFGADNEKVKQTSDEIARLTAELEKYKAIRAQASDQMLKDLGISFTLVTPEPVTAESVDTAGSEKGSSRINEINQQTDALAKSREEYDKILAAIKETDSNTLKLANTNDAVAATFTRIGEVSQTLKLAGNELKQLNSELEKAKAAGDDALAETLSKQIEDVKSKIPSLNTELKELVAKEDELRRKQQELLQLTKEQRTAQSNPATAGDSAVENAPAEVAKATQSLGKASEGASKAMSELSKGMSQVVGGFNAMATGGAGAAKGLAMITAGIKTMSKAMLALMANPFVIAITAIVALLAAAGKAMMAFFTQTSEGAYKFAKIKGVFDGVKLSIRNFTISVGRFLSDMDAGFERAGVKISAWAEKVKQNMLENGIRKGMFKGARTAAREAAGEDAIFLEDIITESQRLSEDEQKLTEARLGWQEERAKLRAERSGIQDVMYSGSQTEQIAAMERMREITAKTYAEERKFAEEAVRIQEERNRLAGKNVTIEEQQKLIELKVQLINLSAQENSELRLMTRRYKSVTDALREQKKAAEKDLLNQTRENDKLGKANAYNAEVDMLRLRIKYENDENTKLQLQRELRKQNLDYQLQELEAQKQLAIEQNEINKKANIRKTYGEDALREYEESGTLANDSKGVLAYYNQRALNIEKKFATQAEGATAKSSREGVAEGLENSLTRFERYLDGMLNAESQYQSELAQIRERYGLSAGADVENSTDVRISADVNAAKALRDNAADIVERDTGMQGNLLVEQITGLGEQIANKTKDEILELYTTLITDLTNQIDTLKADTTGDPVQRQERLNQLLAARARLEKDMASAMQNAEGKGERTARMQVKRNEEVMESLSAIRDMANDVADTFGGVLSKDSKKALNAMSGLADFGISAVRGIETLVNGVSDGMIKTTEGASKAMQTLEKASFILTIISIAVQLISKIVEIASQFTQRAQLQDAVNEHLEKVGELQRENDKLQRAYQSKVGVSYYEGMAKAAKDYTNIIKEQREALADAQALYNTYSNKNSDKAKEAKQQMEDIQDEIDNTTDAQADMFRQLSEELATTNLKSFSQSMAESLVDGFKSGAEGIKDTFDDLLDDLQRSMLTKKLATELEKIYENAFKVIDEKTKDGSISNSEMDDIMSEMAKAEDNARVLAEAYYNLFSESGLLDDEDIEGSQGFGQMTQDQADTLTARFTAVQIEMANVSASTQAMAGVVSEMNADIKAGVTSIQSLVYNSNISLQIAQDQLDQMQMIADNTAMLSETNNRLRAIEQNTSKL